jgi:HAE1 family hydrophobic/amphiphilic exporter-1
MRNWLARASYDHPVTVCMGFLALLVLGTLSWSKIPVSMMPEGFDPNFLWIQVPYPNANPVEVDERIVRPVEDQLSTVPGVSRLVSRAENGSAGFQMEFHGSVNMNEAYNTVTDRIERAMPDLPEDVERYLVYRYNPNDQPVVWAGVVLPETVEDPGALLERLVRPALERQPGVASVEVFGVPQRVRAANFLGRVAGAARDRQLPDLLGSRG